MLPCRSLGKARARWVPVGPLCRGGTKWVESRGRLMARRHRAGGGEVHSNHLKPSIAPSGRGRPLPLLSSAPLFDVFGRAMALRDISICGPRTRGCYQVGRKYGLAHGTLHFRSAVGPKSRAPRGSGAPPPCVGFSFDGSWLIAMEPALWIRQGAVNGSVFGQRRRIRAHVWCAFLP